MASFSPWTEPDIGCGDGAPVLPLHPVDGALITLRSATAMANRQRQQLIAFARELRLRNSGLLRRPR
jgi:hypothetical protein